MRRFESCFPSHFKFEPLAQLVEHLTFNQGVEGSSPSWLTTVKQASLVGFSLRRLFDEWTCDKKKFSIDFIPKACYMFLVDMSSWQCVIAVMRVWRNWQTH
jgi:hypothetical protein